MCLCYCLALFHSSVSEAAAVNVCGRLAKEFMLSFNAIMREADRLAGREPFDRMLHGPDAQWWQRIYYRNQAFKGDVIAILPDGRVAFIQERELPAFYRAIGRNILSLPSRKVQLPYRKNKEKEL